MEVSALAVPTDSREIHLSVGAMRGALEMRGWIVRPSGNGIMPRAGLLAEEYFALPHTGPVLRRIALDGASVVRQCFPEPEKVTKQHFQMHFTMQSDVIWGQVKDAMVADGVWVSDPAARLSSPTIVEFLM